jgi:hypothetical protein
VPSHPVGGAPPPRHILATVTMNGRGRSTEAYTLLLRASEGGSHAKTLPVP